ncbi:hypothetical protein D3C81_1254890 [compost metagenome]
MGVTNATILPAIMKLLLPEKESGNGTGAIGLAQAKQAAGAFPSAAIFATLLSLIGTQRPAGLPTTCAGSAQSLDPEPRDHAFPPF